MKEQGNRRGAEGTEQNKYTRNDPRTGCLSLAELLRICGCGGLLIRKPSETVICEQCGASWDGRKITRRRVECGKTGEIE